MKINLRCVQDCNINLWYTNVYLYKYDMQYVYNSHGNLYDRVITQLLWKASGKLNLVNQG